jgi:hypothetical protein
LKPSVSDAASSSDTQFAGAAPVVPANSFDNRFSAVK